MEFLTKTRLKQLLKDEHIQIKKHLGQNFLIDRNVRDKLLSFARIEKNDTVVEIGPGMGALTESLLQKAKTVYAFEIDDACCRVLRKRFADSKHFHLQQSDFLSSEQQWWNSLPENVKIVGNIPYYIASPIACHILRMREKISEALIVVQKEVGKRFVARCNSKTYGILSVFFELYTESKICYSLGKDVFFPKPKVDSLAIIIKPVSKPGIRIEDEKKFWNFLPLIFSHRRKKLSNVVHTVFNLDKNVFEKNLNEMGFGQNVRIEQLPPKDIYKLFEIIVEAKKQDNL